MCIRDRYKAQEEREKIDPVTQKPVIGADGKAVTETVEDVYKRQPHAGECERPPIPLL